MDNEYRDTELAVYDHIYKTHPEIMGWDLPNVQNLITSQKRDDDKMDYKFEMINATLDVAIGSGIDQIGFDYGI